MKKRNFAVLIVFLTSIFIPPLSQGAQEELSLEQCIKLALDQNPLILSSLEQYQASLARVNQARAFAQPSIDYDNDMQPKFFNLKGTAETYLGVSQSFEFPGKRILRGKIAAKESQEILQDIDLLKLDITFLVKQAFYGLLLAQEKLQYAEQDQQLAQDFLQKAELKHSAGDVAKVEVLRAQVEASKAANEVRVAQNEVKLAKARLNFLLARKKHEPLRVKGTLKRPTTRIDLDTLVQRALVVRPEIKRLNLSLEREGLQKSQAYMGYLPDFDLSLSKHWLEGEGNYWDFTLSLPIPLFFWQPVKGEIAEARANISSLKREAEHLRNAITLEVEEAHMNAVAAHNQITLFEEEIITQAEEVYNMFLFSYQEGEIGSIELIEARRTLLEARKSYADALYNYGVALAALEKSIGQPFEGESL
ncbi:MAG: TolC family protein [Candidatus Aminicenantes bacterium]|jgi:outer membrane protein TolC